METAGTMPAQPYRGDLREETMIINMGPQHPSTHGVLRLILELDGEIVVSARPVVGYLHTGIEKNCEWRSWQQGVAFVTRMDYLSPFFNELAYCLAVERLLGIEVPERARVIRVMLCELNRIASHLVWLATTALELGAISVMLYGFRERERILDIFEMASGLRMNHAYMRIGGLVMDLPEGATDRVREFLRDMPGRIHEYEDLLSANPIWLERTRGVGYLSPEDAVALGATGPIIRASGVDYDVRTKNPYGGYEDYDFDVPVVPEGDCYARYLVRMEEMKQSLRIVEQSLERLPDGPVKIEDPKIRFPGDLRVGPDGIGNSEDYVRHIMDESMEALINHFKLVTQGIRVPPGETYQAVESPRGELGYYVVSDGGTRPYRVRVRDPSFVNLQSMPLMVEGGLIADVVACTASVDPVMGGVDR
ncbi:MAG: NADH dehydrogenase (quinone) subunit D [Actinomycetota bacterium]|nr:NADH dehydrogenase (quinone) subunit D [Actinomycetota bacterium]